MKKNWITLLIFFVCCVLSSKTAEAQAFSFGLRLPVELQKPSVENFYNNLEVTSAYNLGNLFQIEASLLIPVIPLFVSANAKFFFLQLGPEVCFILSCSSAKDRYLASYIGVGAIHTSVATELLWGVQAFTGLDWHLKDLPIGFSIEIGAKMFNIFLGIYSGPFISFGTRLIF